MNSTHNHKLQSTCSVRACLCWSQYRPKADSKHSDVCQWISHRYCHQTTLLCPLTIIYSSVIYNITKFGRHRNISTLTPESFDVRLSSRSLSLRRSDVVLFTWPSSPALTLLMVYSYEFPHFMVSTSSWMTRWLDQTHGSRALNKLCPRMSQRRLPHHFIVSSFLYLSS